MSPASFANPNWKLVDRESKEVHAVWVENWPGKDRGNLQFRRSFGKEWEMGVLLGLGMVAEKERARKGKKGDFTVGFLSAQVFAGG